MTNADFEKKEDHTVLPPCEDFLSPAPKFYPFFALTYAHHKQVTCLKQSLKKLAQKSRLDNTTVLNADRIG